ncbi:unnamed protein product [Kuraishia capsulata CBS 1993]|uniref:Kinesin-like protein n=1 Tax=Kuraishia capsulata CBS 1993 TaxID=1382522 RepID=W6MR75_9ASCO|nr:uncharacterized protein KUCA_T00003726001 [Kuraishia capsulata CBS 1993]CDK27747.1 unnamed protein product [Kuraishia capsulata CBS 1993]
MSDTSKRQLPSESGSLHVAKQRKSGSRPGSNDKHLGNIKVMVRVRPTGAKDAENIVKMPDNRTVVLEPKKSLSSKQFQFDRCFWSCNRDDPNYASQDDTYETLGREMLQNLLMGFNSCILAYGQTGSGKTYTMMGDNDGLIPKTCRELFTSTDALFEEHQVGVSVKVSFFEIYQEQVYDLLALSNHNPKLKIREGQDKSPFVDGLTHYKVESYEEVEKFLERGNSNRTTASTSMNMQSSRSHSVFTISVTQERFIDDTLTKCEQLTSHLRLVDLAGSERASATLGNTESPFKGNGNARFKEGSQINKSLTTLGRILTLLSQRKEQKNVMIPYRESALTWILKESIGGNSKTAMIACISPSDYDETLSTLRYATVTSQIENVASLGAGESTRTVDIDDVVQRYEVEKAKLLETLAKDDTKRRTLENYMRWNEEYLLGLSFRMKAQTRRHLKSAEFGDNCSAMLEQLYASMRRIMDNFNEQVALKVMEAESSLTEMTVDIQNGVSWDLVEKYGVF